MNKTLVKLKLAEYEATGHFDEGQLHEIKVGLEAGVDVSMYASPTYTWQQMIELRMGLQAGIDISEYANPEYGWEKMEEIRRKLEIERSYLRSNYL